MIGYDLKTSVAASDYDLLISKMRSTKAKTLQFDIDVTVQSKYDLAFTAAIATPECAAAVYAVSRPEIHGQVRLNIYASNIHSPPKKYYWPRGYILGFGLELSCETSFVFGLSS